MAWFKMIGMALVISGLGVWGLSGARGMGRRTEELKELRFALAFLEKEISYMHTPLTRALERTAAVCQAPMALLFGETVRALKAGQGKTAGEAWDQGIKYLQEEAHLKPPDIEILKAAAHQLGMSDSSDQSKFLLMLQEEIKVQEDKARQEQASNQKLWSYGGFILGMLIVLLLI